MEQDNVKRVLGIVGSPRRHGNTEIIVDEVLRGAAEAAASVRKVILNELDIAPCQACEGCWGTGECVQVDDMGALLEQMEQNDVWVLGTPVYYLGPTAQFKTFQDRWYSRTAGHPQGRAAFAGHSAILAIPFGDSDPDQARYVVEMLTRALTYYGAELAATVVAAAVNERGAVRKHPELLTQAYHAGREAVRGPAKRT